MPKRRAPVKYNKQQPNQNATVFNPAYPLDAGGQQDTPRRRPPPQPPKKRQSQVVSNEKKPIEQQRYHHGAEMSLAEKYLQRQRMQQREQQGGRVQRPPPITPPTSPALALQKRFFAVERGSSEMSLAEKYLERQRMQQREQHVGRPQRVHHGERHSNFAGERIQHPHQQHQPRPNRQQHQNQSQGWTHGPAKTPSGPPPPVTGSGGMVHFRQPRYSDEAVAPPPSPPPPLQHAGGASVGILSSLQQGGECSAAASIDETVAPAAPPTYHLVRELQLHLTTQDGGSSTLPAANGAILLPRGDASVPIASNGSSTPPAADNATVPARVQADGDASSAASNDNGSILAADNTIRPVSVPADGVASAAASDIVNREGAQRIERSFQHATQAGVRAAQRTVKEGLRQIKKERQESIRLHRPGILKMEKVDLMLPGLLPHQEAALIQKNVLLQGMEKAKYDEMCDERRNRYASLEQADKKQYDAKERAAEKKREEEDKVHADKCTDLESKISHEEAQLDFIVASKKIYKNGLKSLRAIRERRRRVDDSDSDDADDSVRVVSDAEKEYIAKLNEATVEVQKQQSKVNVLVHELYKLKEMKEAEHEMDDLDAQMQEQTCLNTCLAACCPACSTVSKRHPYTASIAFAVLYYIDLITDAVFVRNVWADKENTRAYGIISLVSIIACPLILSVADVMVKTGMGWKGVLLNFTFLRMFYTTYRVAKPTEGETAVSAGKANTDCKLVEALVESVPQLFIQLTALFSGIIQARGAKGGWRGQFLLAWISVIISFLSIAYATTAKYAGMTDSWKQTCGVGTMFIFFLSDAISRALAVSLVAATMKWFTLLLWAVGWMLLDFAAQAYTFRSDVGTGNSFGSIICRVNKLNILATLFTSMPLSTNRDDLQRSTYLTSAVFALMTIVVLGKAAGDGKNNAAVFSYNGNNTTGGFNLSGDAFGGDDIGVDVVFEGMDVLPFALVSFICLAIKMLAYVVVLHRLRRGPGAINESTTGFELFALTTEEVGQSAALTVADCQKMARADIQRFRRREGKQAEPVLKLKHVLRYTVHEHLTFLPEALEGWGELKLLDLSDCTLLKTLPSWFGNFVTLKNLNLSNCVQLTELPSSIGGLRQLQQLKLEGCKRLATLPAEIYRLQNLKFLNLGQCTELKEIPSSIEHLSKLEQLDFFECKSLRVLPGCRGEPNTIAESLLSLDLSYCESLLSLDETFCNYSKLKHLSLVGCKSLIALPKSIDKLIMVDRFDLGFCSRLTTLPVSIGNLRSFNFQSFNLGGCNCLKSLPAEFGSLVNLRTVSLMNCCNLTTFPTCLFKLHRLEHLDLSFCKQFATLPDEFFNKLTSMKQLNLMHCTSLLMLPNGMGKMTKLCTLKLSHCHKLAAPLPDLSHIVGLVNLEINDSSDVVKAWKETGLKAMPILIGAQNGALASKVTKKIVAADASSETNV